MSVDSATGKIWRIRLRVAPVGYLKGPYNEQITVEIADLRNGMLFDKLFSPCTDWNE